MDKDISKKAEQYLKWVLAILSIFTLVIVDQLTKHFAISYLKGKENVVLIPGVLEFEYLENTGAAFSILEGQILIFVILTIVIVALIGWEYSRIPLDRKYTLLKASFVLIIAGAIGNAIDRVMNQYVVDFIYFTPINFPRFNIADSYVTVAMILLMLLLLFYYKEEEIDFLFTLKKQIK